MCVSHTKGSHTQKFTRTALTSGKACPPPADNHSFLRQVFPSADAQRRTSSLKSLGYNKLCDSDSPLSKPTIRGRTEEKGRKGNKEAPTFNSSWPCPDKAAKAFAGPPRSHGPPLSHVQFLNPDADGRCWPPSARSCPNLAKLKQQGVPRHVSNPQCHAPFTAPAKIKRKNKKSAEGAKERVIRSDRESLVTATTPLNPAVPDKNFDVRRQTHESRGKKLKDGSDIYKLKRSVLGRALSFSTCESIFGRRHAEKSKCPN
nr:insulin receptor 2 [Osteobrama belangeri]